MNGEKKLFSICIPVYNNEGNLSITIPYIMEHLDLFAQYDVEIIMVNDGSADKSYEVMKKYKNFYPDKIRIASLTRNFGQGACCHACYEMARGDVIGMISADGQDPFELFADMLAEWERGYKLVIANRKDREDKGVRGFLSGLFHKLIHGLINSRYPVGGFDFLIMDREVLDKYLQIDLVDSLGQLKLLWLGYEYQAISYTRTARNHGKSGYNIMKRVTLACRTIIYESALPIHCFLVLGIVVDATSLIACIIGAVLALTDILRVTGMFYVICLILFGVGTNIACTGVVGEYLWNQFIFIKKLPRYVMEEDTYCE